MKILAREWLIFLACVSVVWVIIPMFGAIFGYQHEKKALEWYKILTTPFFPTLILTLVPYALVQFVRSIVWSVKVSRKDWK